MKITKAVIPAAGLGTRMLPATKTIPKEMLPLVDKPVLQYVVEEAVDSGIEDILIITNRGKTAMDDYFDYIPELQDKFAKTGRDDLASSIKHPADMANIFYVRQKETRGLGHAIGRARRFIGDEYFAVLLGDDVMHSEKPVLGQIISAAEKYACSAIGTREVSDDFIVKYSSLAISALEAGVFEINDMNEKPSLETKLSNYAIMGRYVLSPAIFELLENTAPGAGGEIQLTDGMHELLKYEKMLAVDFDAIRYDTGNLCGFMEATIDYALRHPECGDFMREYILQKAKVL